MGFAPASIEWALRATRNAGLQPAMDHLLAHAGETPPAAGDDDDEEQEALADLLGKKGAGAQEEMIVGAGEAKVSGQEGPIRRAAASCGALRQGMRLERCGTRCQGCVRVESVLLWRRFGCRARGEGSSAATGSGRGDGDARQ